MASKFTIDDSIVRDSLVVVERSARETGVPIIAKGGLAIQMHILMSSMGDHKRPTSDLDILPNKRLSAAEYREGIGRIATEALVQYSPKVRKTRHNYEVEIKDEDGEPFFIHAYKWSENGFEREKEDVARQTSNAVLLTIPGTETQISVIRPEDIIHGKVSRLKRIDRDEGITLDDQVLLSAVMKRNWHDLSGVDMEEWLHNLERQKGHLLAYVDSGIDQFKKALDNYRGAKDMFDIALLLRAAGTGGMAFDNTYLDRVLDGKE